MNSISIESFQMIGIVVRTTNENGRSAKDIPALWSKFLSENLIANIPNKIENDIYCIYTDYEKDHTRPYTAILGCKVDNIDSIPSGMIGRSFEKQNYSRYTAKGKIAEGIVFNEWVKIWNSSIPRIYTADFEIYGKKAQNPENAEIDILIAVE